MLVEGEAIRLFLGGREANTHSSNQPTGSVQVLLVRTFSSSSPAGIRPILFLMTFRRNLHVPGWSSPQ